jgi:CRISPR-associated protein Csx14
MSFSVNVDPTNPGQFFACCGLLELADRLWSGAEGWFVGERFRVESEGTLRDLLSILVMDPPTPIVRLAGNGLEVPAIIVPLAFTFDGGSTTALILDYWTRIAVLQGVPQVIANVPWNFWSGQQTSLRIWAGLRNELVAQFARFTAEEFDALFTQRLFQRGRFGFDPGPAWNALDVGFSPNEQNLEVESSPAVEMLAAIGLQRFRPVMHGDRESFDYFTWASPNSPAVAAAAMAGGMQDRSFVRYRCSVVSRGQYAALGFSYPVREGVSDE